MFAKILPILKLPRRFSVFDYEIPDGLTLGVGDVIHIPFRHRDVLGVVLSLEPETQESRVTTIAYQSPIFSFSDAHLKYLLNIAQELGQSPSSVFSVALEGIVDELSIIPSKQHSTLHSPLIDRQTIAEVQNVLAQLEGHDEISVAADFETTVVLARALCKATSKQVLILVPRERDAQYIHDVLPESVTLTGKTRRFQRNAILRAWNRGTQRILIGTRQSVLIEPQSLGAVLVTEASCLDHQSPLRNPHISAVRAARSLAHMHKAKCVLADNLPDIDDEASVYIASKQPDSTIIDVANRGESTGIPLISQTLLDAIKTALHSQKKVLLCFNRKGVAKRLECKDCGHVPFCGTCGSLPIVRIDDLLCEACGTEMWKPETCPACGSKKIGARAIGGTKIAADLAKAFPASKIGHVEKGRIDLAADIILATEYFWTSVRTPFSQYGLGLVAEILADVGFTPGDFRGAERTLRKIERVQQFAKRQHAQCIIQTLTRDRIQALLGADHFMHTERNVRKTYALPPFGVVVQFQGATRADLPEAFQPELRDRHGTLTAKISREKFAAWTTLFPTIPDHVNIRIDQ